MSRVGEIITMDDGSWCPVFDDGTPEPGTVLYAQQSAQSEAVALFDSAVAAELPRVSHVEYDSHEICKHFASNVRERIRSIPAAPPAPAVPDDVTKDAARYRWLRIGLDAMAVKSIADGICWADEQGLPPEPEICDQVDAAIDAAMLAAAPEAKP